MIFRSQSELLLLGDNECSACYSKAGKSDSSASTCRSGRNGSRSGLRLGSRSGLRLRLRLGSRLGLGLRLGLRLRLRIGSRSFFAFLGDVDLCDLEEVRIAFTVIQSRPSIGINVSVNSQEVVLAIDPRTFGNLEGNNVLTVAVNVNYRSLASCACAGLPYLNVSSIYLQNR